jgi:hypothetical protein
VQFAASYRAGHLCSCVKYTNDFDALRLGEHTRKGLCSNFVQEVAVSDVQGNADNYTSSHIILGVYLIIFGLGRFSRTMLEASSTNHNIRHCSARFVISSFMA